MSYILTIALVTVIAAAFDLPTYTYGKNLQAFVVILLCYGYVTMPRKGVKFAYDNNFETHALSTYHRQY